MKRACIKHNTNTYEQNASSIRPLKISFVRMKRLYTFIANVILLSIVAVVLTGCGKTGQVSVKLSEINNYPVIGIPNPYGPAITFAPVNADTGSIGYETAGRINWLTGKPHLTQKQDSMVSLLWIVGNTDTVKICIATGTGEVSVKLGLSSEIEATKWFFNTQATDDEYFTGALERVVDGHQNKSWEPGLKTALNLRNERVEMKVKPTVAAYAPFYLSSNHYGLFVEGTWPGLFDFCKASPGFVQVAFEGPAMAFKLYVADSPQQIVQQHALETGPSFVPPRWAFGPWRWRDEHKHTKVYYDGSVVKAPYNSEVVEDILMMQAYDIPCTAYWIDRPWGPGPFGYDDFEIDYKRLPRFEKMVSWLNAKDIELMLWIGPWACGKMALEAREKGYGLADKELLLPDSLKKLIQGNATDLVVMDFSNPEAAAWWGEKGPAKLAAMGVKGFKLDRADGEKEPDDLNKVVHSGKTYRENFNDYSRQFVKATFDAVKPVLGDDFVLFPRAQYTGSARYGSMWAGDTHGTAEGLRSIVIGMQRCAVMGYPLWTSDGGGYWGVVDHEVTSRWIGFSCFSPMMEIGPTNNRGFWNMLTEPVYDHELMAVWRFYAKLRMSLVDYVYALAKNAAETGMPVARPLFLEYPGQPESWNNWETYKFGDDLLVSVIWGKGKTSQQVYLPAGETWIDLWDNKEYEGGKYIEVEALAYKTPVFLRKGSTLILPDLNELYKESQEITREKISMRDLEAKEKW